MGILLAAGTPAAPEVSASEPVIQPLLTVLADCLFDDSVHIIKMAQYILRRLLSRPSAQQALQKLPKAISEQLECFVGSTQPSLPSQHPKHRLPKFQLENSELWQPQGKTHDTWICQLTWTLLQHVEDPVLRDCHSAVYHKVQLAELVLPYILGYLATDSNTDAASHMTISDQLSRYMLPGSTNGNIAQSLEDLLQKVFHSCIGADGSASLCSSNPLDALT